MTYKRLKLKIIFTKMSIFQLLKYTITTLESLSTIIEIIISNMNFLQETINYESNAKIPGIIKKLLFNFLNIKSVKYTKNHSVHSSI